MTSPYADDWRLAHILLPWRARLLIWLEHQSFRMQRRTEAALWRMNLERVSRRNQQPAWRLRGTP